MRVPSILLLSLLLTVCACNRRPEPEATLRTTAPPSLAAPRQPPSVLAAQQRRQALADEQVRILQEAASTLHSYLGALADGNLAAADAMWVGGRPPPTPDDAALRAVGRYSARIDTDAPKSLDPEELPSRSLEIPVRLRMSDVGGNARHWHGWYRVRRKIGNDGWEISTASIRPQID